MIGVGRTKQNLNVVDRPLGKGKSEVEWRDFVCECVYDLFFLVAGSEGNTGRSFMPCSVQRAVVLLCCVQSFYSLCPNFHCILVEPGSFLYAAMNNPYEFFCRSGSCRVGFLPGVYAER